MGLHAASDFLNRFGPAKSGYPSVTARSFTHFTYFTHFTHFTHFTYFTYFTDFTDFTDSPTSPVRPSFLTDGANMLN